MTIHFLNTKISPLKEKKNLFDPGLLNLISVQRPYFALKNLAQVDEYLYSEFTTELTDIDEAGPISGAEVGRHMAILGSVVLAQANPRKERHHYLATDAIIKRVSDNQSDDYNLQARARLVELNRKKGIVYGEIYQKDGRLLYTIEVTYMVLVKSIFERMFAQHKVEAKFDADFNPYKSDSDFFDLKLGIESCTATIGEVTPEHCPGHFRDFPALPVARMGTSMGKIAGLHFMHLNPSEKKKYIIKSAELHAKQLIFTGETVMFRTEIINPKYDNGMIIRSIAYTHECDMVAEAILHFHY